ncbi:hypothetical protein P152DRAFT_442476 [Eremomyces bilateralis CBS 781.70]|uniref:VASt domain-containing protein n=1 Tax=Eremomyces bilateralis CBS 781.70 TaxID=1392243 RepID=A0A6G1FU41_9PEZI|nr:uncharacterized protein P152DRAFT_442476 [Eremomyces bilateralis CBS 781.70]KAF1809189.1 hypothetical protein P152DRAFT_442476 [Eremomyces bilateralis CBS 781.70]
MSSTFPDLSTPLGHATSPSGLPLQKERRRLRHHGDGSSSASIASSDGGRLAVEEQSSHRLRASFDEALDKLKDRRRRSITAARLRIRREDSVDLQSNQYTGRYTGLEKEHEDKEPLRRLLDGHQNMSSSVGLERRSSIASDMVTEESDQDECPNRPSLSPHESHSALLTLSSPLVTADAITIPIDSVKHSDPATSNNLATTTTDSLEAPSPKRQRSPSPVDKLKGAFIPGKRPSTPKPGSDSDSSKRGTPSTGGGGGFGAIIGSRKGTFGRKGFTSESVPSLERPGSAPSGSRAKVATTPSKLDTSIPNTPTISIVAASPTTFVTPPTPTDPARKSSEPEEPSPPSSRSSDSKTDSPVSATRRRGISTSAVPPKLPNNAVSAPLTPHLEEVKTPGGSFITPAAAGGFFSSVFSAAQTAATSITNTITNTSIVPGSKKLPTAPPESNTGQSGGEEVILSVPVNERRTESIGERKQLAVETLGSGNLSLSHLGISESTPELGSSSPQVGTAKSSTTLMNSLVREDEANAKAEDSAAARAISAAYNDKSSGENLGTDSIKPPAERSRAGTSLSEDTTPSMRSQNFDVDGASPNGHRRTGSIRSRVSGRHRRHRASSATTGGTIAAAIGASTTGLVNPLGQTGPRLTGFAVANPKRNRDFHQLFRSVPEDDYLIEDYSAALQREILLQGRLYISEGHICFSSNILGWVTNLVISYDEVVSIEKKSTAVIFPNAIVIQTLHARNVFASLVSRDTTYDLIINIWKISHPNLKSSLNGVTLGTGTGDKTEKADSMLSDEESISCSDDGSGDENEEFYDEDADDGSDGFSGEGNMTTIERSFTAPSLAPSDTGTTMTGLDTLTVKSDTTVIRKGSGGVASESTQERTTKMGAGGEALSTTSGAGAGGPDSPGPLTHAPTDCGDADQHYDKLLIDTVIAAPLGKIYNLLFGPGASTFMRRWLSEDQKCTEVTMEDDKRGLGEEQRSNGYSYIKPLNASIGPRQTKCVISQHLEQFELDRAVSVLCSTQNPDVPSGNVFVVKTRYCLMWGPGGGTRMVMNFTVEWSGKSWLKGPIEKNAHDGQVTYAKELATALRLAVAAPSRVLKPSKPGAKPRRRRKDAPAEERITPTPTREEKRHKGWTVVEALRSTVVPLIDIVSMLGMPGVLTTLVVLILWLWLRVTRLQDSVAVAPLNMVGGVRGPHSIPGPARLAAYEQLWEQEENELWKWLEDRVGAAEMADVAAKERMPGMTRQKKEQQERAMRDRVEGAVGKGMDERRMDEAIRVTKERLEALEGAVRRRKHEEKEGMSEGSTSKR